MDIEIMMVAAIFCYICALVLNIQIDAGRIEIGRYILARGKIVRVIFRGLFFTLNALIFAFPPPYTLRELAAIVFAQAAMWWLLFDPLLNLARGLQIDYQGTTSFLDRLAGNFYIALAAKLALLVFAGWLVLFCSTTSSI